MLQGDARVQQSIGISKEAGKVFKEKKYEEAAELFALAAQIEDTEYSFYENAAISYNLAGQYDKASYFFDKVIYDLNPKNGKSEFYKGVMLIKLDSLKVGCDYLRRAIGYRYSGQGSIDTYNYYCN